MIDSKDTVQKDGSIVRRVTLEYFDENSSELIGWTGPRGRIVEVVQDDQVVMHFGRNNYVPKPDPQLERELREFLEDDGESGEDFERFLATGKCGWLD